jgi:hypothetical protein
MPSWKTLALIGVAFWLGQKWHLIGIDEPGVCVGGRDTKGRPCTTPTGASTDDEIDASFVNEVDPSWYK